MNHIDAMKQALDALIGAEIHDPEAVQNEIKNLRKAIEEAEKAEPVGQLQEDLYGRGSVFWFNKPKNQSLLYTAPPQRKWVGLSHEEVNSWELPDTPTVFEFTKFIEAKLKEKNT